MTNFALVAVNENRVIGTIEDDIQGTIDVAALHANCTFIGVDVDLKVLNAGSCHKMAVLLRKLLWNKRTRLVSIGNLSCRLLS